ncbi:hypothetical protein LCGC14_2417080, partial [marine sediment metagenome]
MSQNAPCIWFLPWLTLYAPSYTLIIRSQVQRIG